MIKLIKLIENLIASEKMKILITGVNGQLGSDVYSASKHENYGLDLTIEKANKNLFNINLAKRDSIIDLFERIKPDWTIHCGAVSNPDTCETNMETAWETNVIGTKNIVDACNRSKSKLIFISTTYVFDGNKGLYKEDDIINPINFYGKTKLIGEWLTNTIEHSVIIRTSALLSNKQRSIFNWIINSLEKGEITAAVDLIESPTLVSELSEAIIKTTEKDLNGIYHMAGSERISRYDLMRKVAKTFNFNENLVKPIYSKEIGFKSQRPKDTSLDVSKAKKIGIHFSNMDEATRKLKEESLVK